LQTEVFYENWRHQNDLSEKERGNSVPQMGSPERYCDEVDCVSVNTNQLLFYHRNPEQTVFDVVVAQQGMNEVNLK
jgi:hypothetical protein